MTKKNKILLYIGIVLFILAGIYVCISVFYFMTGDYEMSKDGCPYFDGHRIGRDAYFEDCKGTISILRNNVCDCLWIYDDLHDYAITSVKNEDYYTISGQYIYLYHTVDREDPDKYLTFKGDGKSYNPQNYFINGELKHFLYEKVEEIPQYIKVNLDTGNVELFVDFDDIPEIEKLNFSSLREYSQK